MTLELGVELFLEMVPPESILIQIPILIFLSRLSQFSNFLESTAIFWQVPSFLFPLLGKGLVPKDVHISTDMRWYNMRKMRFW